MKVYLYLTGKYLKSYPKRCISMVVCISLFLFALLTILWYNDSYQYALIQNDKIKNGIYDVICFYADENDIEEKEDQLHKEGVGIINGLWTVHSKGDDEIWIGNVSENIDRILSLNFISGKMPASEKEIAIDKNTYDTLGLSCKIGETVYFEIESSDGKTEKKSFILTGVTDDFSSHLKQLYPYDLGKVSIPTILTINNHVSPKFTHILSENDTFLMRNINCRHTYINSSREEMASKSTVSKIILLPIQIFFILTTVSGVASVCIYFFKDQEQYMNLLRCIGFSKKKTRKLLLFQGVLLWTCALIVAVVGAVLVLLLLQLISSFTFQPLFLYLNPQSLILTEILSLAIMVLTFIILLHRFYKSSPLRENIYVPKKVRKSQTNLRKCWHKANGKRYRLQNLTCIMIVIFCVGMSIFGPFLPLFNARGTTFDNPDGFPDDADYSLQMGAGGSNGESYYIQFPVGCGVSRQQADKIIADRRVKVLDASVSQLCVPFFLTSKNPENKLLYKYVVEAKEEYEYNYLFKHKRTNEMIQLAGGDSRTECLVELPVKWQSYDSMINNIKTFSEGEINEKNYKNGLEIIAPHDLCSVGEEFKMVLPIADKTATEQTIEEHITFKPITLKVAATYSGNAIILSTEYLFSIYPSLNYESLVIENLDHSDEVWEKELEQNLQKLESISIGVKLDDYAKMSKEFYDQVNMEMLQITISVFVFIIIILIAIIMSNYVQVRSTLKSYILMRAIGAKIGTVKKLIIGEINYRLNTGILLGTVCGGAIVVFFSIVGSFIKLWDIYLFYIAPVYITTVIMLYFGSRYAVQKAVNSMIDENIIEKLYSLL